MKRKHLTPVMPGSCTNIAQKSLSEQGLIKLKTQGVISANSCVNISFQINTFILFILVSTIFSAQYRNENMKSNLIWVRPFPGYFTYIEHTDKREGGVGREHERRKKAHRPPARFELRAVKLTGGDFVLFGKMWQSIFVARERSF